MCPLKDRSDLLKKWSELDQMLNEAKFMYEQLRLIHQSVRKSVVQKLKRYHNCVTLLEKSDINVQDLRAMQLHPREVAPGIPLNALEVPTEEFIPDTPLYFIRSTGEWGVKILGEVISGTIGQMMPEGSKKHIECAKRHDQKSQACSRWHPGEPRGWTPAHWMHTQQPLNAKNANMRHIGSRTTLRTDIAKATPNEIAVRKKQLAHDLLIQLAISRLGTKF